MTKKIMVVDNHADQIFTIKQALDVFDDEFEVIGADCGTRCLEILKNGEIPDIILTECRMVGMNGWELLDKIKENQAWKNIPVAFLTAWPDLRFEKFSNYSANEFIEKPFEIEDLKERINIVIKKH